MIGLKSKKKIALKYLISKSLETIKSRYSANYLVLWFTKFLQDGSFSKVFAKYLNFCNKKSFIICTCGFLGFLKTFTLWKNIIILSSKHYLLCKR